MLKRFFLALAVLTLGGCATSGAVKVEAQEKPLLDLQKIAAKSMPLGLRRASDNGREFFSNYFVAKDRKFKPADSLPNRSYAHIFVLGDSRPYTLEIYVHVEQMDPAGRGYSEVGYDRAIARAIRQRVVQQLNKRREELNIIDDFRVF